MTVEFKVTATRSVDGKAGFKVPFVNLELGGGAPRARVGADGDGRVRRHRWIVAGSPVKVAYADDALKG